VHLRDAGALDDAERPLERGLVLAGEADDDVAGQVEPFGVRHPSQKCARAVAPRHRAEDAVVAGLEWDVEVACSAAGVRAARLRASNVPVNVLAGSLVKRRLSLRYVRALRRLVAQGRYDVVHAHLYASAAATAKRERREKTA
jgi:hypothetical protein